jgi:hypothetical protein
VIQLKYVWTGRSVELIHFKITQFLFHLTACTIPLAVVRVSEISTIHSEVKRYNLNYTPDMCLRKPRLSPLRITFLPLSDIGTWCGWRRCRCRHMSERLPQKSEQLWWSDPASCVWNSLDYQNCVDLYSTVSYAFLSPRETLAYFQPTGMQSNAFQSERTLSVITTCSINRQCYWQPVTDRWSCYVITILGSGE